MNIALINNYQLVKVVGYSVGRESIKLLERLLFVRQQSVPASELGFIFVCMHTLTQISIELYKIKNVNENNCLG